MASFTFDGKPVEFQDGDTIGSALHRSGVRVLSRSLKYHRPRGLYCCTGSCASCFVDVDGVPNVPACMRAARSGLAVASQNRIGSVQHDALGVVDKVFYRGFDPHGAFTRPRFVNDLFLKGVRFLSGVGKAPPPDVRTEGPERHTARVDEAIIGAGEHGLRRAREAAGQGRRVILLDELDTPGGSLRWDPTDAETRRLMQGLPYPGVEFWGNSLAFGIYGGRLAVARGPAGDLPDLWEVDAARITVATGRHDSWPVFNCNDLPGVLSLRGAQRLLGEHGVLPGSRVVAHGGRLPTPFVAALEAKGGEVVAQGTVEEAFGGTQVEKALVDGQWIDCDTVVCCTPGTPRVELLQQAGCRLAFDEEGVLAPVTGPGGSTTEEGVWALFSTARRPRPAPPRGTVPMVGRGAP